MTVPASTVSAPSRRLSAALSLLGLVAAFVIIRIVLLAAGPPLIAALHPADIRRTAAIRVALSFTLGALTFTAAVAILLGQGLGREAMGWRTKPTVTGWIAAAVVAALFIAFVALSPILRGAPVASDGSLFRIGAALAMAATGGVFEESIFRGFIISRARALGLPTLLQVLLSGLLFGLAHVGWGGLAGGFSWAAAIGAMVSTGVLGLLLATAYVLGKRSIWPVMAAHAVINLAIEPWLILSAIGGGFVSPN
jgi:membrane protease YdiL (CAAX protease family)